MVHLFGLIDVLPSGVGRGNFPYRKQVAAAGRFTSRDFVANFHNRKRKWVFLTSWNNFSMFSYYLFRNRLFTSPGLVVNEGFVLKRYGFSQNLIQEKATNFFPPHGAETINSQHPGQLAPRTPQSKLVSKTPLRGKSQATIHEKKFEKHSMQISLKYYRFLFTALPHTVSTDSFYLRGLLKWNPFITDELHISKRRQKKA